MSLTADILRGYTDAILLQLLTGGESYGYEMNQRLSAISDKRFELKEATLYTVFRRLETGGYITARWGDEQSGARRRYYAITEAGRQRLEQEQEAWLETRDLLDLLLWGADEETKIEKETVQ